MDIELARTLLGIVSTGSFIRAAERLNVAQTTVIALRMQAVQLHLAAERLHLVAGAPRFSYPVYVVCSANADEGVLAPALEGLRALLSVQGSS
jgi:hypothetical protein